MSWQPEKPSGPQYRPYTSPQWQSPYGQQFSNAAPSIKWPGLTSLILGIICGVALFVGTFVAAMFVMEYGDDVELYPPEIMPGMAIAGCSIILALIGTVVGSIFGIVGLAIPNGHKLLSAIGLCINALLLLGFGLMMIIGMIN